MSLQPQHGYPIPDETRRVAHAARQNPGFSLRSPGTSGLTEFATSITVGSTSKEEPRQLLGGWFTGVAAVAESLVLAQETDRHWIGSLKVNGGFAKI